MIGQWLNVVYAKPWGDKAPKEMTETINAFMLEVLAKSHPHLQARAEWAQTVSIHELGLSARIITLLEGAELDTLYKEMSHQGGKLDNVSIPTYLKYAEALGLTPAARKAVAPGGKAGPRGKLSLLREAEANRASA